MGKLAELVQIAREPRKTVGGYVRQGRKVVGCFLEYAPEELIYAAGLLPVGLWGGQTNISKATRYLQSFCCSPIKANLENGMNGVYGDLSLVVIPTLCDTLKCIGEVWKAAVPQIESFTFVFPQNRKTEAGAEYMKAELAELKETLERVGGRPVGDDDIARSIEVYNAWRATLRAFSELSPRYPKTVDACVRHAIIKAASFMDKKDHTAMLRAAMEELRAMPEERTNEKGVVLTGLLAEPDDFLGMFGENGLLIAADDLIQESKQFRTDVPEDGDSPMNRLARRLAHMDGCSLLFDVAKTRGQKLIDMVKASNAVGVVICQMKFCDPEEFDYPIYKKELDAAGIPMLYLEIEQKTDSAEQLRTRIQTFAEMLSA